jgi:hypothetical protein
VIAQESAISIGAKPGVSRFKGAVPVNCELAQLGITA